MTRITENPIMEANMDVLEVSRYKLAIDDICQLNWRSLTVSDLVAVAWAYYHFSIQFRESLEIAVSLHPNDENLAHLKSEECDTSNLSPWPGVATIGERMNHDEFMRRTISLASIEDEARLQLEHVGETYLKRTRSLDDVSRALSIASYEDGGLESVFYAILTAPVWEGPVLQAFRHFLTEHIRFDSDPDQGHGALSRHMAPDDRVLPLWEDFHTLLTTSVPRLTTSGVAA
jgi:hypothetical protein